MAKKKATPQSGFASIIGLIILVALAASWFTGGQDHQPHQRHTNQATSAVSRVIEQSSSQATTSSSATTSSQVPTPKPTPNNLAQLNFSGQQIIQVNNGQPSFSANELATNRGRGRHTNHLII